MPPVKRITDLTDYTTVLPPYAREMFGIYQPLLGWKSKRIQRRFEQGLEQDRDGLVMRLTRQFGPIADVKYADDTRVDISVSPGGLEGGKLRAYDSIVLDRVAQGCRTTRITTHRSGTARSRRTGSTPS